ncbi:rRNA maturation RNase YbeY [Shimia sediminis]|uniref:rRNA maturation RNase YbeY n=1 Tax=Shimia sediminis TaxID=2497945 RepID=UPI000F8DB95F|nr:rRNA maturation RNase YbeY [Shimia sediminis]
MLTDTILEDPRWEEHGLVDAAEYAATAALVYLKMQPGDFTISLLACDDARIAVLNADFRDKLQPTNVLSWPSQELAADEEGARPDPPEPDRFEDQTELGDIAIAYDTCQREAEAAGKPFDHHVTHLVIHGVLHLLGYDHIRDKDATLMEGIETAVLGKLGIPDPYKD